MRIDTGLCPSIARKPSRDLLVQPRLAATLEALGRYGLDDFYRGEVGRSLAADLAALGSPLTFGDFSAYQAAFVEPLSVDLSVGTLWNLPPPTQGVSSLGVIVIQYHGKSQILSAGSQGEQDVTAALLRLESSRTPEVCWVGGDGEVDLKNTDSIQGYSSASDQILKNNYSIKDLILAAATAVPADCDIVALVGPTKTLPSGGIQALTDYLNGGGRLLLAIDPWRDSAVTSGYNSALTPYGLSFNGGLVVPDAAHAARGEPTAVAVVQYGGSPIAKGLTNSVSFFPETTSIDATSTPNVTQVPAASTTAEAYLITVPRQPPFSQRSGDKQGPFTLMETAERAPTGGKRSRVVLVGTGAFAENEVFQAQDVNVQLLTGSLNYLTEQESLISIPPKPSNTHTLSLTQEQQNLNLWVTLVALPLLVIAGGLAVWWRRRLA